jgi:uracil-DNA glycosylase
MGVVNVLTNGLALPECGGRLCVWRSCSVAGKSILRAWGDCFVESVWMKTKVSAGWKDFFEHEMSLDYMKSLVDFLNTETRSGAVVFPPLEKVFRALQMVDKADVRVVILGQDPYHGENQANGLAFAVSEGVAVPPSLANIFKEVESDLGAGKPCSSTLEGWAEQGVLLLNTVLTVRAHEAFSHRDKGWETFTEAVVRELNACVHPIVFLLWGAPAQKKARLISNPMHLVLQAPHPSPLSAYRGFLGCRHFSRANAFLAEKAGQTIDWLRS